jgi:hypothetical protein
LSRRTAPPEDLPASVEARLSRTVSFDYFAFGLGISSDLEFEELLPSCLAHDIRIRLGPTHLGPDRANGTEPGENPFIHFADRSTCILSISGTGQVVIANGTEIVVEPVRDADVSVMRLFILGTALGAILQQRHVTVLHGSAIVTQHGAVMFAGRSGSGKSTIAAGFYKRGFPVLSDDVCALDGDSVWPGTTRLKLRVDALRQLDFSPSSLRPIRADSEKYFVPLGTAYARAPVPLRRIYVVRRSSQTTPSLTHLRGLEKFEALASCIYRSDLMGRMGLEADHFEKIARLAAETDVTVLTRPHPCPVDHLVDIVMKDFS